MAQSRSLQRLVPWGVVGEERKTNVGLSLPQDWMKAFEEVKKRRQKELETAALKRSDTITQRER